MAEDEILPVSAVRYLSEPFSCDGTIPRGQAAANEGWVGVAARASVSSRTPQHNPLGCKNCFLNLLASFYIAASYIFKFDTLLGCALAVCYTLAYWTWAPDLAVNMSWNIVSLAVIFPISQGIGMGFKRREQARSLKSDDF